MEASIEGNCTCICSPELVNWGMDFAWFPNP
jgi:hypothetical protein